MNILDSLSAHYGLCTLSVCAYERLLPHMTDTARRALFHRIAAPQSVLVSLFPYFAEPTPGNLSLYARARDYHAVIQERLGRVAQDLQAQFPNFSFVVLVDDSPIPEVYAAAAAGLGVLGDNGLLIHPDYGSYVFIGTIVTDLALPAAAVSPAHCLQCGACRRICPVDLDKSDCLSALTQKGGTLTEGQALLVQQHPLIWGCDLCQTICPMNRNVSPTTDPDFTQNYLCTLTLSDLDGLTRKQFVQKYPERAFTWRGPAPLRRNLILKQGDLP